MEWNEMSVSHRPVNRYSVIFTRQVKLATREFLDPRDLQGLKDRGDPKDHVWRVLVTPAGDEQAAQETLLLCILVRRFSLYVD